MKRYHKNTFLFMLVFLGIIMVWNSAYSEDYPVPQNSNLRSCTSDDEAGTCLKIGDSSGVQYIVRAVRVNFNSNGEIIEIDRATPPGNWPQVEGGVNVYRYWAGVSADYLESGSTVNKPSAWSYIVFDLEKEPLDADPPGAQLPLGTFTCGDDTISADRVAYKLNPSVNFKGDALFSLYDLERTSALPFRFGHVYVLYGKVCDGGSLWGGSLYVPETGTQPLVEARRFRKPGHPSVLVNYDQLTRVPLDTVECERKSDTQGPGDVYAIVTYERMNIDGEAASPWFYAVVPGKPFPSPNGPEYRVFTEENIGPEPGTAVFTLGSGPVYLWGNRQYWCPPEPPLPEE
jgi:hypothetical protein